MVKKRYEVNTDTIVASLIIVIVLMSSFNSFSGHAVSSKSPRTLDRMTTQQAVVHAISQPTACPSLSTDTSIDTTTSSGSVGSTSSVTGYVGHEECDCPRNEDGTLNGEEVEKLKDELEAKTREFIAARLVPLENEINFALAAGSQSVSNTIQGALRENKHTAAEICGNSDWNTYILNANSHLSKMNAEIENFVSNEFPSGIPCWAQASVEGLEEISKAHLENIKKHSALFSSTIDKCISASAKAADKQFKIGAIGLGGVAVAAAGAFIVTATALCSSVVGTTAGGVLIIGPDGIPWLIAWTRFMKLAAGIPIIIGGVMINPEAVSPISQVLTNSGTNSQQVIEIINALKVTRDCSQSNPKTMEAVQVVADKYPAQLYQIMKYLESSTSTSTVPTASDNA